MCILLDIYVYTPMMITAVNRSHHLGKSKRITSLSRTNGSDLWTDTLIT